MTDRISVIIKPNAKKNEVLGFDEERQAYKVAVKAPAEKGKANAALITFLSRHFKRKVQLVSGATSRKKQLRLL